MEIQIWYWNAQLNSWLPYGTPAYSGSDGLYYFFNVAPGYTYYLGINGQYFPVTITQISYQDIPVITL